MFLLAEELILDTFESEYKESSIGYKNLKLVLPRKNILIERREGNSSAKLKA